MKAELDPRLETLTERIIGCAFTVSTALGYGFLEAVYKKALFYELACDHLRVEKEKPFTILYKGAEIGKYFADLVVEGSIIVELKTTESINRNHFYQVLNYLKASRIPVGLLLNFGARKLEIRRVIL